MSSTFEVVAKVISETSEIPLEAWTEEVNQGRASVDDYFILKNLCARIDELVAAKTA